jgi:anti-sigma factor RsiW
LKSLKQTEVLCRDLVEVVTDYLEDALSTAERAAFEQHLHACPWCLTYLDQVRMTSTVVQTLAEAPLPQVVEDGLRTLFRVRRQS